MVHRFPQSVTLPREVRWGGDNYEEGHEQNDPRIQEFKVSVVNKPSTCSLQAFLYTAFT